jgi:hypothetical protein
MRQPVPLGPPIQPIQSESIGEPAARSGSGGRSNGHSSGGIGPDSDLSESVGGLGEGFGRAGRFLEDLLLLKLATPSSPTVVKVESPSPPEQEDSEFACDQIDTSQLTWPGASANALDLMRRVFLRQAQASCQVRSFVADVPASELAEIEKGITARREAAESCRLLLAAARASLAADPAATSVARIGVISGYRSASTQLTNWIRNFPRYYEETRADRTALNGGEFGDAAAALLTRYISVRLASPGFSLHNDGRAVDFLTVESGHTLGADTRAGNRTAWRSSWFFQWLTGNANGYGFFQNTSIDEPWHWEFRGAASTPPTQTTESAPAPDTSELANVDQGELAVPSELAIFLGRLELTSTPLLAGHRGTQPDLILRWNDMTDPPAVDVVIHLHGYSDQLQRMKLTAKEAYSGLDFSNPNDSSDTRPGRTSPTLCILPRGSYAGDRLAGNPECSSNAQCYTFPALITPSGVHDLIAYSLGQFQTTTGASAAASTRREIVTAHSGGGAALMRILAHNTPDEVHVFDALYWGVSPLISWVNGRIAAEIQAWAPGKTRADGGLCVLCRTGTKAASLRVLRAIRAAIAGAPPDAQPVLQASYRVLSTKVAHGEIPRRFGWRLLADITADLSDAASAPESEATVAAEDLGDGSPFVSQALDTCWSQVQALRKTVSAHANPARLSRVRIGAESGVTVDANPYSGLGRGQLEAVIRAGFNSYQMPATLLALWAKEGSLRMSTAATPVPLATTAENARALFRSNVYYVDLGSDYFVVTSYDSVRHDNVWVNRDDAAPGHEARFRAQAAGLVGSNLLSQDIAAAVNAELAVSAGPPFTVTPTLKFYALSLLLMDALFTRMQRNTFPQLSSISEPLNYIQWNIGTVKFGNFLASAELHRQEPAHRLPSGDPPSLEQWALHTVPRATEWHQPRVNATRFMHYIESYRPIFGTAITLIKPGIEDLRLAPNVG